MADDTASFRERYGEWALVTGASAGIGAEFARALAARGMSCVLSARREDRLRALARELEETRRVETRVIPADLAVPDGAERLADAVARLEIGVLVNNAGFGYAGRFEKLATDRLRAMVQVNCMAPVVLTSRLLPSMRARGRGAVIVTGSVAGRQPLPLHGVYSATKAFDLFLGESLWAELRGSGIDVLVIEPGATSTEFQDVAGEVAHAGEPPERVVAVALAALGRQPSVVSGWMNWVTANANRFLPRAATARVAEWAIARQTPAEMR
ncbi:MAG: SDR family oxidoreductase [Deltaproteobacteria bacterium]|nr:MAG: SDR family oxidoreductase [Deltaproteobacteria bacterium]